MNSVVESFQRLVVAAAAVASSVVVLFAFSSYVLYPLQLLQHLKSHSVEDP